MGHTVALKLKLNIAHPVFYYLSPCIGLVIIDRKNLVFQNAIQVIQIMFVLLLDMQIFIVRLGYNKTVVAMINKFRDPAIICAKVDSAVHTGSHTTCSGCFSWHPWVV